MPFDNLDRNATFILNNGGEPHDVKDGPQVTKLTYDTPKAIEGLQFLHDLRWKHQVSPINADQRGGLSIGTFLPRRQSLDVHGGLQRRRQHHRQAPAAGLDWDFLTLPKGPGGQGARVSMDGYVLDKQTKLTEQSWTVLRELVSGDMAQPRAEVRKLTPPRRSGSQFWEKGYEGKTARIARPLADAARADPRAFWKNSDIVGGIMEKHVQATFNRNEMGIAEAMRSAMAEVRGFYGK